MINFVLFFLLLFEITVNADEAASWKGSQDNNFIAQIELSSTQLRIDDFLNIKLTLTYPAGYHPKIEALRRNLVSYSGMSVPPFYLVKDEISSQAASSDRLSNMVINFTLAPNVSGKHFLTFKNIVFESDNDKNPPVKLLSDVFNLTVEIPKQDFQPELMMAPLMPMSQELLITADPSIRKKLVLSSQEFDRNAAFLQSKAIPWETLIAAITVVFSIMIIIVTGSAKPSSSVTLKDLLALKMKALNEIDSLSQSRLIEQGMAGHYFTKLDNTVRNYFDEKYQLGAITSTTQEFLKITSSTQVIDPASKSKLFQFLQRADYVKFAKHQPTPEECAIAEKTAKDLITMSDRT